eukprot:Clim_evm100s156 gene=Clim_evmTU100s156
MTLLTNIGLSLALVAGLIAISLQNNLDHPLLMALTPFLVRQGMKTNGRKTVFGDLSLVNELDRMVVVMTGTGTPAPDPNRAAQGISVFANGEYLLFDTGPGIAENMATQGMPRGSLSHVFFTHYHSDHIGDFGEVMTQSWMFGRSEPLQVHGPTGAKNLVDGFLLAYSMDQVYRTEHHTSEVLPKAAWDAVAHEFEIPKAEESSKPTDPAKLFSVYTKGDLTVQAFRVHHEPVKPAVGYKVTYKGRSVVIGGDSVMTIGLTEACKDADVCILDGIHHKVVKATADALMQMEDSQHQVEVRGNASFSRMSHILSDILDYHADALDLVELAKESRPSILVPIHMVPAPNNPLVKRMLTSCYREPIPDVEGKRKTEIRFGEDGMALVLPVGSMRIGDRSY